MDCCKPAISARSSSGLPARLVGGVTLVRPLSGGMHCSLGGRTATLTYFSGWATQGVIMAGSCRGTKRIGLRLPNARESNLLTVARPGSLLKIEASWGRPSSDRHSSSLFLPRREVRPSLGNQQGGMCLIRRKASLLMNQRKHLSGANTPTRAVRSDYVGQTIASNVFCYCGSLEWKENHG